MALVVKLTHVEASTLVGVIMSISIGDLLVNMKADKNGFIEKGFTLNEQDFRRLIDTSKEMLLKKGDDDQIVYLFKIKFLNGTIYETSSLDEVLNLDNGGSGSIKMLETTLSLSQDKYRIRFNYNDPEFIDNETKGITFSVFGEDRDWVFVTISQIEERLKFTAKALAWAPRLKFNTYMTIFLIGIMLSLTYTLQSLKNSSFEQVRFWDFEKEWEEYVDKEFDLISELKLEANKSPNAKPIEVFIKYKELLIKEKNINQKAKSAHRAAASKWANEENSKNNISNSFDFWMLRILSVSLGFPIVLWLYTLVANYVYPLYVFSWGDSKDEFEKRDNIRKYVLGTVIVGIIISFIAGILAKLI